MALVDTRFNSYRPTLDVIANNNVVKLGSVSSFVVVRSIASPGKAGVPINTKTILGVNSVAPGNIGSTITVTIYVGSATTTQASNTTYKTFPVKETFINTLENTPNYSVFNPRIITNVAVSSNKVVMSVRTVVVQESNKVYGFRISYLNNKQSVSISDRNFSGDRKCSIINERYVFVQDTKNDAKHVSRTLYDPITTRSVEIQNRTETKRIVIKDQRKSVVTNVRRAPISIETKFVSVNVIDDSIPGSGGGGGGGGGGAGVLTEFWS